MLKEICPCFKCYELDFLEGWKLVKVKLVFDAEDLYRYARGDKLPILFKFILEDDLDHL